MSNDEACSATSPEGDKPPVGGKQQMGGVSVAVEVGFSDQSHLTRRFKGIVGLPPGQYAQMSNIVQDEPLLI
jgi:hypothetical protein